MRDQLIIDNAWTLVCEARKTLHGWCEECKSRYLFDLVIEIKPSVIVEIGVYRGLSIASFSAASLVHPCKVIGIDSYKLSDIIKNIYDKKCWVKQDDLDFSKQILKSEFSRLGLPIHLIEKSSFDASLDNMFGDESIDILHIDASHTVEDSLMDVLLWLPKIAIGGYLIFDDANWEELTLAQSVAMRRCVHVTYLESGNKTRVLKKIL